MLFIRPFFSLNPLNVKTERERYLHVRSRCTVRTTCPSIFLFKNLRAMIFMSLNFRLISALEEAPARYNNDPAKRMEDESQRTIKFIYGLSNAYAEFKGFYENKLLPFPDSLDAAFTEASTY